MNEYVRAYEGDESYIFVSYAHKDSGKVLPVVRQLFDRKYRVWYDEGIKPGTEWPDNIDKHLRKAAAVIVFVSENSLISPNCKNEMSRAPEKTKMILIRIDGIIIQSLFSDKEKYDLNESLLNKLAGQKAYDLDENLLGKLANSLDDRFIGDGITGYEYSIEKKKSVNKWNILLGLAAVLAVGFSVPLYGLYNGWFDSLLPAKQPVVEAVAPTAEPQEVISIGNNILGSILPVEFSSEEEKNAVYDKLGWGQPYEMTYKDLVEMDWVTYLEIGKEPIDNIKFAAYLPNLEGITLSNAHITDLSPLIECPNLKTVQVTADMLPMTLPAARSFEVEII